MRQGTGNETLSEAEALAKAGRTGTDVEIVSLRGESSEVYATPDGKLEAREHLRPVRARVDGAWQPIDTGLAKRADGTVAPGATTVRLEFSGGGDEPLVRMERAGRELALSWPTKLPAPELDADTATYRNVLPDVDLRMGAQEDGFTQLLAVKSAEAAASPELNELRLKLSAQDLDVRETATGGLEAVDEGAGSTVFQAPRPVMWDSSPGKSATAAAKSAAGVERAKAAPTGGSGDGADAGESGKLAPVGAELPANGRELWIEGSSELRWGGIRGALTESTSVARADFEVHVYHRGKEVGIFGSNGWFPKHGKSADVTVPRDVYNNLKGLAVGEMRAAGRLGPKGTENIKGDGWKRPRIAGGC